MHRDCGPGTGSGKTRVLVHELPGLIQVSPLSRRMGLLPVTFNNKAAGEMRGRIGKLLNLRPDGLWIGTFHGICHRLLRIACSRSRPAGHFPDSLIRTTSTA